MKTKPTYEQQFSDTITSICHAKHAQQSYYVATFGKAGKIAILNEKLAPITTFEPQGIEEIQSVSIHPHSPMLVVAGNNAVHTYDLNGNLLQQNADGIKVLMHSADGKYVWCIRKNNENLFTIEVRNAENINQILAEKICDDELYDSEFMIGLTPQDNKIYFWQAAGQDGLLLGFAQFTGKEITVLYPGQVNENFEALIPVWGDSAHEFLLEQQQTGIFKYQYPSCKLLEEYHFPEDNKYDYSNYGYLNKDKAFVECDYQFWILNLNNMQVEAPFYIEGHEPQKVSFFYPSLADDEDLMTDIYNLQRIENTLIGLAGIEKKTSVFLIELADLKI